MCVSKMFGERRGVSPPVETSKWVGDDGGKHRRPYAAPLTNPTTTTMELIPVDATFVVVVHLFARVRELAGAGTVSVELAAGATVCNLRAVLGDCVPALRRLLPSAKFAVNHDFVADDCVIRPTDEVAVIPPVSGG